MPASNTLTKNGISISKIAARFGTPLYIYNTDVVADQLHRVRNAFPKFDILYALKANPNVAIAHTLAGLGTQADVTSQHEIKVALQAGYTPNRIVYGGPGKTDEEIESALRLKIDRFDVESEKELIQLQSAAKRLSRLIQVTMRVNPLHQANAAGEIMGGIPSQFGIDEKALKKILKQVDTSHLRIQGIHVHVASQVLDANELLSHYTKTVGIAKFLIQKLDIPLSIVNLGGGIGVPYGGEVPLDIDRLGRQSSEKLPPYIGERKIKYQLELGRFLVAEGGLFVTRILDIKQSMGTNFIIVDGGISAFSRPAMPWAQQHRCTLVTKSKKVKRRSLYTVVGRSCLSSDILCKSALLSRPSIGDLIVIHDAGAYGYSMTMQCWGGHRPPKEVVCSKINAARLTE